MSPLLRKLLGHVLCAEAPDGGGGGPEPAPAPVPTPAPAPEPAPAPAPDDPGGAEPAEKELSDAEHTAAMQRAITEGLKDGTKTPQKGAPREVSREDDAKNPAERAREKVIADARAKEEQELKDRLKGKKTDDFMLSQEERRALGQTANRRFHDLIRYSKVNEETIKTLSEQNTQLQQAKDTIMGVLGEHGIKSGDQLMPLLRMHQMLASGDLETALKVVEHQRKTLLTQLGREADGVDLLAGFNDLKTSVDDGDITRERAIEIAQHRRVAMQRAHQQYSTERQQHQTQAVEMQRQQAYQQIVQWEASIQNEPGYTAKRAKVNEMINDLIREYPPQLWLSTIKRIYATAQSEAPRFLGGNGASQPLRPGGSGGGLPDPKTMEEAIAGAVGVNPRTLRMN